MNKIYLYTGSKYQNILIDNVVVEGQWIRGLLPKNNGKICKVRYKLNSRFIEAINYKI